MDVYTDYFNPGSYDDKLIAEKLGYSKKPFDLNEKLRNDDLERKVRMLEIELSRKKAAEEVVRKPQRESFTPSEPCQCKQNEQTVDEKIFGLSTKNFLLVVIAVLVILLMNESSQHAKDLRDIKSLLGNKPVVNTPVTIAPPVASTIVPPS